MAVINVGVIAFVLPLLVLSFLLLHWGCFDALVSCLQWPRIVGWPRKPPPPPRQPLPHTKPPRGLSSHTVLASPTASATASLTASAAAHCSSCGSTALTASQSYSRLQHPWDQARIPRATHMHRIIMYHRSLCLVQQQTWQAPCSSIYRCWPAATAVLASPCCMT